MDSPKLNPLAKTLIRSLIRKDEHKVSHGGIRVNPVISEIASWYERIRNVMEYREEEVILRAAIERILRRKLILGGNGETVAEPLLRELVWARYFPDGSITESKIETVKENIDNFLLLRKKVIEKNKIGENEFNTWFYHLMSSHITRTLNPQESKESIVNFMFFILKNNVIIEGETEETRDAQVFISIRRAYAKNDIELLRYYLFLQFFGEINNHSIENISDQFSAGYVKINEQLKHPLRHNVFVYIKKQTPPFLILDDLLSISKGNIEGIINDKELLKKAVFEICQKRYEKTAGRVRRAIIRAVIFILLSKSLFALLVEGTFENLIYGRILWNSMAINITIPAALMAIVGLFIQTPSRKNSEKILSYINTLLFEENPTIGNPLKIRDNKKNQTFLERVFSLLWLTAFFLSFGIIVYVLFKLNYTIISQIIFLFFLAIVTFLAYRINQIAHIYTVEDKQSLATPIVDFFFMPIAQVGRHLTEGIAQINILLFFLDFIIETPFKAIFSFSERFFFFLHAKREVLE